MCIYRCLCLYLYTHTQLCIYSYSCLYPYMYTCIHVQLLMSIPIHVYMYSYAYTVAHVLLQVHNSTNTCSCYYMLSTYMQRTAKLLLLKALLFSNIIAHMYIAVHVYRYNRHEQLCIYTCHACIGIDMSSCKY